MQNFAKNMSLACSLSAFLAGCGGELHPFSGPAPGCSPDGFCDRSLATDADLNAVFGFGADDVWIVGDGGLIAHWDGVHFSIVPSPTRANLWDVWGGAPDDVWVVGCGGTLLHWNGQVWQLAIMDPSLQVRSIWGSSGDDVWTFPVASWIGSYGMRCLRANLHFDGQRWEGTSEQACESILALWGPSSDDIWAAGCELNEDGTCRRGLLDRWDGEFWHRDQQLDSANILFSLSGTAPDDVWAVGCTADSAGTCQEGVVLRFDGQTWAEQSTSVRAFSSVLKAVWAVDRAEAWAAGSGGRLMRLHEAGWTEVDSGVERNLHDLFAGSGCLWTVGERGTVLIRPLGWKSS